MESEPREQGTPQQELEDKALGSQGDEEATTGADSPADAAKESDDDPTPPDDDPLPPPD